MSSLGNIARNFFEGAPPQGSDVHLVEGVSQIFHQIEMSMKLTACNINFQVEYHLGDSHERIA
jgi:hypothetical protein